MLNERVTQECKKRRNNTFANTVKRDRITFVSVFTFQTFKSLNNSCLQSCLHFRLLSLSTTRVCNHVSFLQFSALSLLVHEECVCRRSCKEIHSFRSLFRSSLLNQSFNKHSFLRFITRADSVENNSSLPFSTEKGYFSRSYSWVRLSLNSKGNSSSVSLQTSFSTKQPQ